MHDDDISSGAVVSENSWINVLRSASDHLLRRVQGRS